MPALGTNFRIDQRKGGKALGQQNRERVRLTKNFFIALYRDFAEHGEEAVSQCRERDPIAYVRIVASLMPRDVNICTDPAEELKTLSDSQLRQLMETTMARLAQREREIPGDVLEVSEPAPQVSAHQAIAQRTMERQARRAMQPAKVAKQAKDSGQ